MKAIQKILLIFLIMIAFLQSAQAEKMDIETHNVLIQKLQQVIDLSEEGVSKQNLIQRLADLHSERARLYAMENEGKGDITYKKEIEGDRKTAISLYEKAIKTATQTDKPKILLQMAQLHHLLGQTEKSKNLYADVIKNQKKYDSILVAQAYIEMGEYEYSKQNFTKARKNYESALAIKNSPRQGYVKYRIAWCEFQSGSLKPATVKLVTLLSTPEMFQRADGSMDLAFQEEASRDLSTFLARQDISANDVKLLSDLSPSNVKEANLTYLATELDRTGKKKSALLVWGVLGTHKRSDDDKLEGQIKIARIQYDLNKKDQAVLEIQLAAKMLKENDCDDKAKCESYRQQLRKIVTDWGLAEERNPSTQLIAAYNAYLSKIPDLEMNYWAGIAAQKRKQWTDSYAFYRKSSEMSYEVIHDSSMKGSIKNINQIFEGSLLGAIEAAEQSKNIELRNEAYTQYLKLNPKGAKALEVQYQIAQVLLERNENVKAANKFKEIALSEQAGAQSIKDKSADLALDTLVVLKDDENLEKWAIEFSVKLEARRNEFLTIARKSILNQAAKVINTSTSNSELQRQFDKLSRTNLNGASQQDRISFQKHKMLLATKLKDIAEIIIVANAILKEKGLTANDIREAKLQLVWAYEMKLDFKNALAVLKTVEPEKGQLADHTLKLGVMAELAGLSPNAYYEKFLSISNDKAKKQEVALSLVRVAKNHSSAFKKYKEYLIANPKLYVVAGLYAYDEKKSETVKKDLLNRGLRNSFETQLLLREQSIEEIQVQARQIAKHKLSKNLNLLKRSIDERLQGIQKMERLAQKAITQQDFTLQFLSLAVISSENQRLAQDILSLPQPKGLTADMKKQYKTLLNEQVAPYTAKAEAVKKKMDELWSKKFTSSFKDVMDLANSIKQPGSKLALEEIYAVTRTAKRFQYSIQDLAQNQQSRQKLSQELTSLKMKIQKNPFDLSYLEKLKEVEASLGSGPMVAYLDARLSKLKSGGQN